MTAIGILLMLLAAACNASASVLQRRASQKEPASAEFSVTMLVDLVGRPVWLGGIFTMITGFVLHAVSISVTQIALVQPLLVAELPFTLVLASWAFRLRLARRDWTAIIMASVGLALFTACLAPSGGAPLRVSAVEWAIGVGATAAGISVLVAAGYRGRREHRAALLGVATGAAFGLNSSLIAGAGAALQHGGNLFTTWQIYGVAVVGPLSFFLLQNALAAGNLVASQPGFTLTNPLVSVSFGLAIFGEHAREGLWLVPALGGAALIVAGTVVLARSDLLDPDRPHERADMHSHSDVPDSQESPPQLPTMGPESSAAEAVSERPPIAE